MKLRRYLTEWRGTLIFLVLMVLFRSAWADWVVVPSGSMNPTVLEGDRVLIDKHAYGLRIPFTTQRVTAGADPQRGDVVVLESPEDTITLFKRVIAVPGDVVEMHAEHLRINGVSARYSALPKTIEDTLLTTTWAMAPVFVQEQLLGQSRRIMLLPQIAARRDFAAMTIPSGRYLVLGDNRDNSKDSRYIGLIERDAILGRAERVIVSLNPENHYLPRSERFLVPLF
jgi:signal peptidase I